MASSAAISFWVVKRFDISQYKEVTLVAHLHDWGTIENGQAIKIALYNDGYTEEDPTTEFYEDLEKSCAFDQAADSAPYLRMAVATSARKALVANIAVKVTLTQGNQAACSAVVSADLILRD